MKTIRRYILLVALTLSLAACSKEFLTEDPRADIYPENLLVNYDGFKNMNNALMGMVRDEYDRIDVQLGSYKYGSLPFARSTMWSCGVDNAWGNNRHTDFRFFSFPKNIVSMTDAEPFMATFEWLYKVINTANMVIARSQNEGINWQGGTPEKNTTNRETTVAEARLIRAWAYRHLTYSFGDVPLTLEEITGSNYRTDWQRTPIAKIREEMEKDWLYAIEKLPMRTANNTKPSAAVARHYLGELYLAIGKPLEAKNMLQSLVEGSEYGLMTARFGKNAGNPGNPFIDLFRSPLYSDGNREVLLAFLNAEPESVSYGVAPNAFMRNMWQNYYSNLTDVSKLSHWQYPGKSIKLFWSLNAGKGAGRTTVSIGGWKLYDYKGQGSKDYRYDKYSVIKELYFLDENNVVYPIQKSGKSLINLTPNAAMSNDSDPTIKQYNMPSTRKWEYLHPNFEQSDIDQQYNDMVYLRLAETYLLYAEALYKLNDGTSYLWVNKLRRRANVSEITLADMSIDLILDERSRELVTEEQRRHTLIRLSQENGGNERLAANVFKRRVREHNEVAGRPVRGMHDDQTPVLFPLPKSFIDSNSGRKIEQNLGY